MALLFIIFKQKKLFLHQNDEDYII